MCIYDIAERGIPQGAISVGAVEGEALGRAIREAREAKGLNQTQLARALGVGQSAVSGWETGVRTLDVPALRALERELGVSFGQSGLSADAAYRLGQASGELRAIGRLAEEMARQAFAAADRVAVPTPLAARETGTRAREALKVAESAPPYGAKPKRKRG